MSKADQIEERIMLALRTRSGINLQQFEQDFGADLQKSKQKQIEMLLKNNFVKIENGHLFCTDDGFKVLNQVILQLI